MCGEFLPAGMLMSFSMLYRARCSCLSVRKDTGSRKDCGMLDKNLHNYIYFARQDCNN